MNDNFYNLIKDVTIEEIIDIFKNYVIKKSNISKSSYINIYFKYPDYFVENFGTKIINETLHKFILMNSKRRMVKFNDLQKNFKINFLETIFFVKNCRNGYNYITDNLNDKDITGLYITIINRKLFLDDDRDYDEDNCIIVGYDKSDNESDNESDNHWYIYNNSDDSDYNGKGIRYYNNVKIYEGEFKDGKYDGKGIDYYINGTKIYEGEFKDGKYDGKGIKYYDNDTKEYEGEFKDGDYNGKGIRWKINLKI